MLAALVPAVDYKLQHRVPRLTVTELSKYWGEGRRLVHVFLHSGILLPSSNTPAHRLVDRHLKLECLFVEHPELVLGFLVLIATGSSVGIQYRHLPGVSPWNCLWE